MTPHDDVGFSRLASRLAQRAGLRLDAYKPKCLRRRIAVRMRACNVKTYDEYLVVLDQRPEEYQKLADAITINVTKFFRNRELWDRLQKDIVEELLAEPPRVVRIWSAGCASGEEPYSVVMLFAAVARDLGRPQWIERVLVEATDIDRLSLERARKAWYPDAAFSETPPGMLERYTMPAVEGGRLVVEDIRRRVRVERLDLVRQAPVRHGYDLILCRNALIYFDRPTQDRLFLTFADALRPGGYLVLGKVETVLGPARERLELVDPRERIYRRPAA
ncbi:MAG: protein-glutamate O-methyltransferase CheR [Gemmatimonadales bacterium]